MTSDILLVDNFYEAPDLVRAHALKSQYANIELTDYPGFASRARLTTPALKARFEALLGETVALDSARFTWGGFRFVTADTGRRAVIHADAATDWAAMVYLTPGAPDDSGTGFFRHRASGRTGPPSDREARAMGYPDSSAFDDAVIRPDKADLSKWERVRRVEPVFNRLILFRGAGLYHAPLGGCGEAPGDARLTHIFFFNTVPHRRCYTARRIEARSGAIALLDAACAFAGFDQAGQVGFAPVPPGDLARHGGEALARRAVRDAALVTSAAQLAAAGADFRTLLLVRSDPEGGGVSWRLVDGCALLGEAGAGLDLRGALLRGIQLPGATLTGCDLAEADLAGADLTKADLGGARLCGADLSGATLFSASLMKADLTEADLSRCDLRHADLRQTRCARTAFRGADLWNAYTWDADLATAFTDGAALDRGDDLSGAIRRAAHAAHADGPGGSQTTPQTVSPTGTP